MAISKLIKRLKKELKDSMSTWIGDRIEQSSMERIALLYRDVSIGYSFPFLELFVQFSPTQPWVFEVLNSARCYVRRCFGKEWRREIENRCGIWEDFLESFWTFPVNFQKSEWGKLNTSTKEIFRKSKEW